MSVVSTVASALQRAGFTTVGSYRAVVIGYSIIVTLLAMMCALSPTSEQASAKPVFKTLYSFPDGGGPQATVVRDSAGNLYGTAFGGNLVYEFTRDGTEKVIYTFCGYCRDGSLPGANLIIDQQGNLYGTTSAGAVNGDTAVNRGDGTVFKITAAGKLTTLAQFAEAPYGRDPEAPLIRAANNDLFGLANTGGSKGYGVIFSRSSSGTFKVIYNFDPKIARFPVGLGLPKRKDSEQSSRPVRTRGNATVALLRVKDGNHLVT